MDNLRRPLIRKLSFLIMVAWLAQSVSHASPYIEGEVIRQSISDHRYFDRAVQVQDPEIHALIPLVLQQIRVPYEGPAEIVSSILVAPKVLVLELRQGMTLDDIPGWITESQSSIKVSDRGFHRVQFDELDLREFFSLKERALNHTHIFRSVDYDIFYSQIEPVEEGAPPERRFLSPFWRYPAEVGYWRKTWMGWVWDVDYLAAGERIQWKYHTQLGWVAFFDQSDLFLSAVSFWSAETGWAYTNEDVYPNAYRYAQRDWITLK